MSSQGRWLHKNHFGCVKMMCVYCKGNKMKNKSREEGSKALQ